MISNNLNNKDYIISKLNSPKTNNPNFSCNNYNNSKCNSSSSFDFSNKINKQVVLNSSMFSLGHWADSSFAASCLLNCRERLSLSSSSCNFNSSFREGKLSFDRRFPFRDRGSRSNRWFQFQVGRMCILISTRIRLLCRVLCWSIFCRVTFSRVHLSRAQLLILMLTNIRDKILSISLRNSRPFSSFKRAVRVVSPSD